MHWNKLRFLLVGLAFLLVGGCPFTDSDDDSVNTTFVLTAADKPDVAPCPTQDILADQTTLDELKNALLNGAIAYLDVPFDGGDLDIYSKKCGLDAFWNPADNVNMVAPGDVGMAALTLAEYYQFGNAGICAAGFNNGSFGNGEGFPVAGTYRKEIKATLAGFTYHLRFRLVVTGTSAGNLFAAEGIVVPQDMENTLVYEVDGVVTAHADLYSAIVNTFLAGGGAPTVVLTIKPNGAGAEILRISIELICVSKA